MGYVDLLPIWDRPTKIVLHHIFERADQGSSIVPQMAQNLGGARGYWKRWMHAVMSILHDHTSSMLVRSLSTLHSMHALMACCCASLLRAWSVAVVL